MPRHQNAPIADNESARCSVVESPSPKFQCCRNPKTNNRHLRSLLMAPADSNVRKLPEPAAPQYRVAPQNLEAEQALLGAILVNNEAFYRVSDFLEPGHFFEPLHQQLYELASTLIPAGKLASPVTLKTFLPSDVDIGGLNPSPYLSRLSP